MPYTANLDGLRWGDLYRLVDLAREANLPPQQEVEVAADDDGRIELVLGEPQL